MSVKWKAAQATVSGMRRIVGAVAGTLLVGAYFVSSASAQEPTYEAAFSVKSGKPITAQTFVALIQSSLFKDGKTNVKDATFFFQQCYGGAFVDRLKDTLAGTNLDWVAGSASSGQEKSFGQNTPDAINRAYGPGTPYGLTDQELALLSSKTPQNYWTQTLVPEVTKDQTVFTALQATSAADPAGATAKIVESAIRKTSPKNSQTVETPQIASGGQGNQVKLKDAAAASHHAVLWTGNTNRGRYVNDVNSVKTALTQLWGDPKEKPNVTIVEAASLAELEAVMKNVSAKLGPNEQFVFYASDHGEVVKTVPKHQGPLGPGMSDVMPFTLDDWQFTDMMSVSDNVPTLSINYRKPGGDPWSGTAGVFLNGTWIGDLVSDATSWDAEIPKALLSLTNSLQIDVKAGGPLEMTEATFTIGQIPTFPDPSEIPEPTSIELFGIACLAACAGWRLRLNRELKAGSGDRHNDGDVS